MARRLARWLIPPPGIRRWVSAVWLVPAITVVGLVADATIDMLVPAPGARAGNAAAVLDGCIYVVGGDGAARGSAQHVESLDPLTGAWRVEAALIEGRAYHAAASAGGRLYAFGGLLGREIEFIASMEVFDPRTGEWQFGASLPRGINRVATASEGEKIYLVGGIADGVGNDATILVFDAETEAWDSLPPMSLPRHGTTAVILHDILYVIGGYGPRPLGSVEAFDLEGGTWSEKASLLVPRGFAGAAAVDGRIYLYGGRVDETRVVTEVYDPQTDTWTAAAPIPEWRDRFASASLDGKIYVIGGEANRGMGYGREVLVYDVGADRWSVLGKS